MKKNHIRSLLGMLLALCLLLTMLPVMGLSVFAAETPVTLTLASAAAQDSETRYLLYFTLSGATVDDLVGSSSGNLWNNNTVYVDGVATTTGVNYVKSGEKLLLCLKYEAVQSGSTTGASITEHILKIPAGTVLSYEYTVAADLYFRIKGTSVTALTPATLTVTETGAQDASARYLIHTTMYTEDGVACDSVGFSGFTAYVDGVATTHSAMRLDQKGVANDGGLYFLIPYAVLGGAGTAASMGIHTVELRANTVIGSYILTDDVMIAIRNGTTGVVASEVTGRPIGMRGYSSAQGHWRVTPSFDQVPTGGDSFFYGLDIQRENFASSVVEFYRNGTGFMFICWASGTEAPADGATITAKAGTAVNGDCTAVLHLPEDLTVKYHAATAQWYYLPNAEATVTLELDAASSSATGLYFNGDNAFATPAWGTQSTYATPDSGVFINGSRISCTFQNYASGKWYLGDMGDVTFSVGDEMVIKGYFHQNSQNVDTYFEELTLQFDGTKWRLPSEDDDTTHLTITAYSHASTDNGQWRIFLKASALPTASAEYQGLTVETNGITITDKNNCFYKTGDYFMIVCYGSGTAAPADGATITIRAGVATSRVDPTQKITLDEDFTVQYHAARATWYLVGTTATPLVTTTLSLSGEQTGVSGIYLNGDNIYETPAWGNHLSAADITSGVYFNGNFVSGALFQNYANGKYYLGSFGTATAAGDTLRICGNFVNKNVGRVVCFTDITFVWTGNRWAEIVIPDEADVTLSLNTDNPNASTNGIYLTASDSLPVSGWSSNVLPTWVYGQQNGVLLNGVMTEVYLRKFSEGNYYVCLVDKGVSIETGDVVTVQGAFTYEGYTVQFNTIDLLWNGSQWCLVQTVTPSTLNSGLDFNVTPTDPLAYNGDWSCNYYFMEGGVWVNGVFNADVNSRLVKLGASRYYVAAFSAAVGDTVTVDGMITDGTNVVRIARTNFLKTESGWTITEADTYDKTLTFSLVPDLSMVDGDLHLTFALSTGIAGQLGTATYRGLSIAMGNTVYNPAFTKDEYGNLVAVIPSANLPIGDFTAVVKKGVLTADDNAVTMFVNRETSAYVNGYGIGVEDYVTYTEDTSTVGSGSVSSVTFTVTDATVTGRLTAVGEDSGVFVNGARVKAAVTKSGTTITVNFAKAIATGDTVMLTGLWMTGDARLSLASSAAKWDGSDYAAVTGDLTFEKAMSVADSSYLLEGTVTVNGETAQSGTALHKAGKYTVVRTFVDRCVTVSLLLYREGDLNLDNTIDILDVVLQKRYETDNTIDVCNDAATDSYTLRVDILATTKTGDFLPSGLLGETGANTFITSVTDTNAGTVVIGMADSNNGYRPDTDSFNDYGFDWVIDLNVDRPIKILQLTDTQIIDAAQERTEDRLGASSDAAWATDKMDEVLFDCLRATVLEAKPDLILMTGDNIYGEFDDAGTSLQALIEVMESLQIPWAPIYGNHDNESRMGVAWQNAQLQNATYCLFVPRHEIGGNGNYSIGIAKNGELQRAVYMMDTNYCGASEESDDLVKKSLGFTDAQKEWVLNLGLRVNSVAGKTIPSILGYHVENHEVWLGAIAAGYEDGAADLNSIQYTLGEDVTAQPGDLGFKFGRHNGYKEEGWLEILQTIGADGTFFGHQHVNSLSVMYGGIRWTYGLKTGAYDQHPSQMGGTLITLSDDGSTFTLSHVITMTE